LGGEAAARCSGDRSRTSFPAPTACSQNTLESACGFLIGVAVALLFLVGGGFGAYKFFFETNDGALIAEVNDPDAELRFRLAQHSGDSVFGSRRTANGPARIGFGRSEAQRTAYNNLLPQ
jgi:hypothetical protein